jgi:site-specific recombinase XerD
LIGINISLEKWRKMSSLVPLSPSDNLPALPAEDVERAADYAKQAAAFNTRRGYRADFDAFTSWCAARGVSPLPATPETVAGFLASQAEAGFAAATIGRRISAISYAHRLAGHETPTNSTIVKTTLKGIRRTIGGAPNKKAPAVAEIMRNMAAAVPPGTGGARDRALLLLGFGGAFRRSELIGLDVADLQFEEAGLKVTIRHSKTDQESMGQTIAIARGNTACPVKAVRDWLDVAGITEGPLFRAVDKAGKVASKRLTGKTVNVLVKDYAKRIGLDPKTLSAHSLRSGFLTSAAKQGASVWKLQEVSRHKSIQVLSGYVRDAKLFEDHAGANLL